MVYLLISFGSGPRPKNKIMKKLLLPYNGTDLRLKNRIVMAPMTRSRAIGNLPNALMVEYYGQRNAAGLIITEGTAPSPEALGYPRMPGVFSDEQVEGWKRVTAAVHNGNARIFLQLMHPGRIGHDSNLPANARLVGASAIRAAGQISTDALGMQDHSVPVALTTGQVQQVIASYVAGARNATAAGFDGVELHGANGYLIEQFLNPNVNNRVDQYGGSIDNRIRFAVEVAKQVSEAIGREEVGIRLSPNSTLGDLQPYDPETTQETYTRLARQLNGLGIAYIHIAVDPRVPIATLQAIRREFKGTVIHCNNFNFDSADAAIEKGEADLIAFGRSFIANPDLVERFTTGASLNPVDFKTLYTLDGRGYTDYPTLNTEKIIL
jgi:N-ethylmaleimide reductase